MSTAQLPDYAHELIRGRRATRAFRPDPVPEDTLREVFALASAAPSNSNTQPWHVEVVSGAVRDRLSEDLLAAHASNHLSLDFPYDHDMYAGPLAERRREAGEAMYGALGIGRDEHGKREAFNAESLRFYGAPHVALLFMPPNAEERMAADVGMYGQTLLLSLAAHGIASCPQGLLSFYADTIRASLGIENRKILFGVSFGYADTTAPVNSVAVPRAALHETTRFHS
ncbi:nitroreductase [Streptomyces iconiensis]|uniref:Nitroreductase n=1 Tax=Streptomyces iconiensis TaxID=1384038 RepID=A0ABT6ZZN0_9ACTN|nr:nitroreductase [Streptomyces iconiensis]MDJ1134538.1 nitroreductase [Streptomyces iconiensis]